jgi:hypothetical protein
MGRRGQIYGLAGEDIHPRQAFAQAFELRQMRMQVEGLDAGQQAQVIQRPFRLDRRRRAMGVRRRAQSEAVFDRNAKAGQQGAGEPAEPLARGTALSPWWRCSAIWRASRSSAGRSEASPMSWWGQTKIRWSGRLRNRSTASISPARLQAK